MIQKLIFFFLFTNYITIGSAATVKIDIQFIDHEELLAYNFNARAYANYQMAFQDSVTAFFKNTKEGQNVKIIQTLDPNLYPFYSFSAKPMLADSIRHQFQKMLMRIRPIVSLHVPFSSEIIVTINGGTTDRGLDYSPQLKAPLTLQQSKYEYADFAQTTDLLTKWLHKEALPLLIEIHNGHLLQENIELSAAEKTAFSTVHGGLAAIEKSFTNSDGLYWTVLRKMNSNDRTLLLFKTMLDAHEGRIDYAQKSLQMIYQFENNNSLLRYVMDELSWRINFYKQKENSLLQAVSKTYNEETLSSDLQVLKAILKINHLSSPALIRLFSIEQAAGQASPFPKLSYNDFKHSDPLRQDTLLANDAIQAYNNYLRGSTIDLFIAPESFDSDFEKYAEIALKLEAYEFAADLYWMLKNQPVKTNEKVFEEYAFRFEYALTKLSPNTTIDKKLKKKIKRLDKKFRKEMKKSPYYKN